jgi:hypothetical protein
MFGARSAMSDVRSDGTTSERTGARRHLHGTSQAFALACLMLRVRDDAARILESRLPRPAVRMAIRNAYYPGCFMLLYIVYTCNWYSRYERYVCYQGLITLEERHHHRGRFALATERGTFGSKFQIPIAVGLELAGRASVRFLLFPLLPTEGGNTVQGAGTWHKTHFSLAQDGVGLRGLVSPCTQHTTLLYTLSKSFSCCSATSVVCWVRHILLPTASAPSSSTASARASSTASAPSCPPTAQHVRGHHSTVKPGRKKSRHLSEADWMQIRAPTTHHGVPAHQGAPLALAHAHRRVPTLAPGATGARLAVHALALALVHAYCPVFTHSSVSSLLPDPDPAKTQRATQLTQREPIA